MAKKTNTLWIILAIVSIVLVITMLPGTTKDSDRMALASGIAKQTANSGGFAGDILSSDPGRAGTDCSMTGYAHCYEDSDTYGIARAKAKIAYSSPYDTQEWGGDFVIDYYCSGDEFKYVFQKAEERWLDYDEDGLIGGTRASTGHGQLIFTKEQLESAPRNSNGNTFIHMQCFDRDKDYYDDGAWDMVWLWVGWWLEIAPSDMSCATDDQCPTKERCDVNNEQCVPVECKIDSDCSLGTKCINYQCGCTADSDCDAKQKCDTSSKQCIGVECKLNSDCSMGVCIDYSCGCRSNWDCNEQQICDPNSDQCMGVQCTADTHCASNTLGSKCLVNNICGCGTDNDCNSNQICSNEWCLDVECKTTQDCPASELCYNNNCITGEQADYLLYIDSTDKLQPGESIEKSFTVNTEALVKGSSGYIDFWVVASDEPQTTQVTKHYAFVFEKEGTQ